LVLTDLIAEEKTHDAKTSTLKLPAGDHKIKLEKAGL